ncbi:MAG TPA: response regulator transcription factor [Verrucomicrobiae bacterium]|nr:response regulator transcription factor [Verrucomicrobiae bacterium]
MNKKNQRIRVLLADDHPVVRKGILFMLSSLKHLEIVGEAVDGQEAVAKVKELSPDIALMDIEMPRMSGLDATKLIRKDFPKTRVLILSVHTSKQSVLRIIQSGAQGYVLKDASLAELVNGIESVHRGEPFFSPNVNQIVLNQYLAESVIDDREPAAKRLSAREQEVLAMIAEGQSNKEMAVKLGVGVRTIETHRERVMAKLGIHSIAGLTKYAIAHGIAKLDGAHAPH